MTDSDRRARRRESRRPGGAATHTGVKPLELKIPLTEMLSGEGVEKIHQASMRLLKEVGILIVDYPPAAETFRQNGAKVEWVDSVHTYPNGDTTEVKGH
jgi:trimethylamine:corrinoid methyltransferase-like protein